MEKVRTGLSAGRVQSPALRMIVERELEIEAFKPKEYWKVTAKLEAKSIAFEAKLYSVDAQKVAQFTYTQSDQVTPLIERLKAAAQGNMTVTEVSKNPRNVTPQLHSSLPPCNKKRHVSVA